jgi:mRNA-degrading endonuclease toxin of MazEF toxin-antitoxin module
MWLCNERHLLGSTALCHHVTTLDRSKLKQRLGKLSAEKMLDIEQGLKAAMDMR